MAHIFISHTEHDRAVAQRLAAFLEGQGRTVYWHKDQRSAAAPHDASMAKLASAKVVIVIWSKSSVTAPFVLQEAVAARDAHKVMHVVNSEAQARIIPVRRPGEPMFDALDMLQISLAVYSFVKRSESGPVKPSLQPA